VNRVFLDANVLLSAAWQSAAALQRLWRLDGVQLLSSGHAVEEARRNLDTSADGRATHLLTGDWEHFGPYFRDVEFFVETTG